MRNLTIIVLLVLAVSAFAWSQGREANLASISTTEATPTHTPTETLTSTSTKTPTHTPERVLSVSRLTISRFMVDAEITVRGITKEGVMDSPKSPFEVVWYDFTNLPGTSGNAVFAGHLDWHTGVTGVFWNLKNLEVGDSIEVIMSNNTIYRYQMSQSWVENADADFTKVVGPTDQEMITLITCSGEFIGGYFEYSHRLIVQAERVN